MATTWRGPGWNRRASAVTDAARRDPNAVCWRCGQPFTPDQPIDAGHTQDGNPHAPLAAEHRACNRSAGATAGNTRRAHSTLRTTR